MMETIYRMYVLPGGGYGGEVTEIDGFDGRGGDGSGGVYTMAHNRVDLEGAEDPDIGPLVEMLKRFYSTGDY